jgi:hypothetical protein
MTMTITATIPARKTKTGHTYPARVETFTRESVADRWVRATGEKMLDDDVISIVRVASNWADIRREFFPMCGFHA